MKRPPSIVLSSIIRNFLFYSIVYDLRVFIGKKFSSGLCIAFFFLIFLRLGMFGELNKNIFGWKFERLFLYLPDKNISHLKSQSNKNGLRINVIFLPRLVVCVARCR
jgi:hypothetical protein